MKKIIIIATVCVAVFGIIAAIIIVNDRKQAITGFTKLTFEEHGTMDTYETYEVECIDSGIRLSYFIIGSCWDGKENAYVESRRLVRSIIKDEDSYQSILKLLNDNKAYRWNGFNNTNPHVLDGGSFNFTLSVNDEIKISAHGTNSYPTHYYDVLGVIQELILIEDIKETTRSTQYYQCQLPQEWLNNLKIRYSDTYDAFFFTVDDRDYSLFIIYYPNYEYTSSEYQSVGTIQNEAGNICHLYLKQQNVSYLYDKLNDQQKQILDNLTDDVEEIGKTIQPVNGYVFVNK